MLFCIHCMMMLFCIVLLLLLCYNYVHMPIILCYFAYHACTLHYFCYSAINMIMLVYCSACINYCAIIAIVLFYVYTLATELCDTLCMTFMTAICYFCYYAILHHLLFYSTCVIIRCAHCYYAIILLLIADFTCYSLRYKF